MIYLDRLVTLRHIARITGVPFRALQDWRSLGTLVLFAAVAATLAWWVVAHYLNYSGPYARLVAGGLVMAVSYGALSHLLLGRSRGGLAAARDAGRGA